MAKTLSRTVSIYVDGKQVESTLASLRSQVQHLTNLQKKMTLGSEEYIQTSEKIREINGVLREHRKALEGVETTWDAALEKFSNISDIIMGVQSLMEISDSAVGALKDLAADAAALDDAYADVMKTTGLTKAQVQDLNEQFKRLDTRTSREELNKLAYEAGKLGKSLPEDVAGFVSAADKINVALGDVLGADAMVDIGKLSDIYSQSTEQLQRSGLERQMLAIGSAINSLGQASTANEAYMVDFLKRLGGIAQQAHLSADQVLGFASALDQNGQAVEMSATAFQKLIQQMIKKPEEFVAASRMSLGEFRALMERDMNQAIQRVLAGMNEMGSLNTLIPMFEDMGLDGARAATVVASLAGSLDKVAEAQRIASEELTTGNSVLQEFNTKNSTMAAEQERAKKAFEDMRIELGEKLYPVVIHLTKASTLGLKGLSGYLNLWKDNKAAAVALTSAMAALVLWLTRSYIAQGKKRIEQAKSNVQEKIATMQAKARAAAEAKSTLQIEKKRLAELKAQYATKQQIISENLYKGTVMSRVTVDKLQCESRLLLTQITRQQTAATAAHTAVVNANKAALASTPWGAVIAAVTALTVGIVKLVKHQRRFREESNELSKQIGNETAQAKYLFDKLEKLDAKSEDYRATLSRLNELYPEIIQHCIDEEGALRSVEAARSAVIEKIRQQITEQRKLDKYGEVSGSFESEKNDALARMHDYLKNDSQYQDLLAVLPSTYGKDVTEGELFGLVRDAIGVDFWKKWPFDKMRLALRDYAKALHSAYLEQKKWQEVFGDVDVPSGSTSNHQRESGEKDWMYPAGGGRSSSNQNDPTRSTSPEIDKAAVRAAEREAQQAAKELQKRREESLSTVEKILSEYAKRNTVETVNSALAKKDQEITDAAKALMDANSTTAKDGTIQWVSEEAKEAYVNLVKSRGEIKKGVINDWLMKMSEDTKDLGQRLNDLAMVDLSEIERIDPHAAQDWRDLVKFYTSLKNSAEDASKSMEKVAESLDNTKPLEKWIKAIDIFGKQALQVFSSINDIISNSEQRQLQESEKYHDEKIKALDNELEQGILSVEEYNDRKKQLDEDLDAEKKELERKQFNRQKALSLAEATINGAAAALNVLADSSYKGPLRWVEFGAVTAAALAQIAAIASQPAPYAKGGYTKEPTILVGERGQEWVASNRLLRDPATAPVIDALEQYQRGNRSALDSVAMQGVDLSAVSSAAQYRQQQATMDAAMLSELRLLRQYLSDPRNRQAVISRTTQESFDANENFLRNARKI